MSISEMDGDVSISNVDGDISMGMSVKWMWC